MSYPEEEVISQDLTVPNRPDGIGLSYPEMESFYRRQRQSKYAAAMRRYVASLKARATPVDPADVRGKRRRKKNPQDASHTIRVYLKALEMFSFWMRAEFGQELDPENVTREVCFKFTEWFSDPNGVSINRYRAETLGPDTLAVYDAAIKACSIYGQASIRQIYAQLKSPYSQAYAADPETGKLLRLHKVMSEMVRASRSFVRDPSTKRLREQTRSLWSATEKDPDTFVYFPQAKIVYKTGSISSYLGALSAMWDSFLEGDNTIGGEAPLRYNPWKGIRSPLLITRKRLAESQQRKKPTVLSHQIIDALIEAASGTDLESRRNRVALFIMLYTGSRAEETSGLLRKDMVDLNGVLAFRIIGKGDKERFVPIYSEVRTAIAQFDAMLEELSSRVDSPNEDTAYRAVYAATLLRSDAAPVVPSMPRWGSNDRSKIPPEEAALEPLDTSGVREMIKKLATRARVFDKLTGVVRPLSEDEVSRVHPHALRHYAATAAQEAGLPMEEIRKLLGHTDVKTTGRYVHVDTRAVAQFGAYIAKSRAGASMTPEEMERLRMTRKSLLDDPSLSAASPSPSSSKPMPAEMVRTEAEGKSLTQELVSAPKWAYQAGAEKRKPYLPTDMSPDKVPRGQGFLLTFRIGAASNLPWWAGRSNNWAPEQMAPIISFYQTFSEIGSDNLRKPLVEMFQTILESRGVTAASAYAAWIDELVGVVSTNFFSTMQQRGDVWMDFEDPALPGQKGLVRTHRSGEVLKWLNENADMAGASILRAVPQWEEWKGQVSEPENIEPFDLKPSLMKTTFRVEKLQGFSDFFDPERDEKGKPKFRLGTGAGSRRIRFRRPFKKGMPAPTWMHAIIIDRVGDIVTIVGDPMPDVLGKIQVSTKGIRRVDEADRYPVLVAARQLPDWFFSNEPLLELPPEERKVMREWFEKLQGKNVRSLRVVSAASEIAEMIQTWQEMRVELGKRAKDTGVSEPQIEAEKQRLDKLEKEIRSMSAKTFDGVEVDPKMVTGKTGVQWEASTRRQYESTLGKPIATKLSEADFGFLDERGQEIAKAMKLKLPAIERRIFAYVEIARGKPWDDKGIQLEDVIVDGDGIYSSDNLRWTKDNNIQHTEDFKSLFFRTRGTDSECVVKRTVRALWERKKEKDIIGVHIGGGKDIHKDIVTRHMLAMMAYLVPCPQQIERDMLEKVEKALAMGEAGLSRLPTPLKRLLPIQGKVPALSPDKVLSEDMRRFWEWATGKRETQEPDDEEATPSMWEASIGGEQEQEQEQELTKTESTAKELEMLIQEQERDMRGKKARPNAKMQGIFLAMPNPVTLVLASHWPV